MAVGAAAGAGGGGATAAAATERPFVYALEGEPESLDPAKGGSERYYPVAWLMCDALLNISRDGQRLEPALAESWSRAPDGLDVTFTLRRGVTFHDGTPLDAGAVKASFERQFRPSHELYTAAPRNPREKLLSDLIQDIETPDPMHVRFRLKYPGLHYLSQVDIVSVPALRRLGAEFGKRPVCTGPFAFESRSADRIVLRRNEKFWGGVPKIPRVVFRFMPDTREVVQGLVRGEVDLVPRVRDPVFFERLREHASVRLVPVPALNVFYLGFYLERPPFDDPEVRRAVAHAINVERAVTFLGRGAAVAARGPLAPSMKGYDGGARQPAYDPERARQLLARSGRGGNLTVRLVHNAALTLVAELAGAIQNDLKRVGVNVELLGKPSWSEVVKGARAREGDMFLYDWNLRAPYPERLLVPLFHSQAAESTNLTRYRNPALDRLLDRALRLPEGDEQSEVYARVQRLIVEDVPMVFLYHAVHMAAHSARVRGLELNLGTLPHDKLVRADVAP